jgi:CheY-like chemotaxis protein
MVSKYSAEEALRTDLVLVIDDDPTFCELVRAVLTGLDFEVLTAPDGLRGIELARGAQPAVILLDMVLPGLGGIATCQQLKQDPVLSATVVVAVTASTDLRYIEQAFRAGAEFFLMKPLGSQTLVQAVQSAVQRAKVGGQRRTNPRFPVDLPVRCVVEEVGGRVANAGLGGLKLHLAERLAPGTKFRLKLELPTGVVTAEAKVIWQDDELSDRSVRYSHGVQLLGFVEDSDLLQYKRFLIRTAVGRRP